MAHILAAMCFLAVVLGSAEALALPYSFTKIADSTGAFASFEGGFSMNGAGTVAFQGTLKAGGQGIFVEDRGVIRTIADSTGPYATLSAPVINADGLVAFHGVTAAQERAIVTGRGGPLTPIAETTGPFQTFGVSSSGLSINAGGTVAFYARLDTGVPGMFTATSHGFAAAVDNMGPFGDFGCCPWINDMGAVAFLGLVRTGGASTFVVKDGALTRIAGDDGLLSGGGIPTLNNAGTVAFQARLDNSGFAIFRGNGGPLDVVVGDTNQNEFSSLNHPFINSDGRVAFVATLDTAEQGIFTGPDLKNDKVVGTGDTLFGGTVTRLGLGGLNDAGQLVFFAVLDFNNNKTLGIYRADPVPAPSSLLLLGVGPAALAGLALARRGRTPARRSTLHGNVRYRV